MLLRLVLCGMMSSVVQVTTQMGTARTRQKSRWYVLSTCDLTVVSSLLRSSRPIRTAFTAFVYCRPARRSAESLRLGWFEMGCEEEVRRRRRGLQVGLSRREVVVLNHSLLVSRRLHARSRRSRVATRRSTRSSDEMRVQGLAGRSQGAGIRVRLRRTRLSAAHP